MKTEHKALAVLLLFAILALTFPRSAQAFDGRTGEVVEIKPGEIIADDLYVSANQFTLDGIIQGDLVVTGTIITINGKVEGDLIAAGQTIVINGTVADDARIAGAVLQVGDKASIGDDLVAAGASLELQEGAKVGGELAMGAGQALLAGEVTSNAMIGTGALELRGRFGGNVIAEVGDPEQDPSDAGGPPMSTFLSMFMQESQVSIPDVKPGLSISDDARIAGNFEYVQTKKVDVPANVVGGNVTHKKPVIDPATVEVKPTRPQLILNWVLDLLRSIVTLVLFGLLLGWLAPAFTGKLIEKARVKPVASLGWGIVTYAAFFFATLVVLVAMILGAVIFGALTLSSVSTTIVWIGILAIFALAVLFALAVAFGSKIVVAWLGGKLLLGKLNPALADHKFAPLILGVFILAVLMALPYIGWFFSLLAALVGLGAIWMWGSELRQADKETAAAVQA